MLILAVLFPQCSHGLYGGMVEWIFRYPYSVFLKELSPTSFWHLLLQMKIRFLLCYG